MLYSLLTMVLVYWIECTLCSWLLCLSVLHYYSWRTRWHSRQHIVAKRTVLSYLLLLDCWQTVWMEHWCRHCEVLLKRNMINIKFLAGVWQFLVRLQPHHCIWSHAGLFSFNRLSLSVWWLNSDSSIFSKFLWPAFNQPSPEVSTNFLTESHQNCTRCRVFVKLW